MNELILKTDHPVIKTERYTALIEEIQAARTEGGAHVRDIVIDTNWAIGEAIYDYVQHENASATAVVKEVSKDVDLHPRGVWDCYRAKVEWGTKEALYAAQGGGKNVCWSRARQLIGKSDNLPEILPNYAKVVNGLQRRYGNEGLKVISERIQRLLG